jgi:predicted RNA-binding protein (virulence factor B family)
MKVIIVIIMVVLIWTITIKSIQNSRKSHKYIANMLLQRKKKMDKILREKVYEYIEKRGRIKNCPKDIAKHFGVSEDEIEKALTELVDEGRIESGSDM